MRNSPLAAASVASARSVPAISMPSAANVTVPSSKTKTAAKNDPCGRQPYRIAASASRKMICAASSARTESVFAAIRPQRGSGELPSRLSTP
jgi:hypothetical protein